jgi:hypothetical protein
MADECHVSYITPSARYAKKSFRRTSVWLHDLPEFDSAYAKAGVEDCTCAAAMYLAKQAEPEFQPTSELPRDMDVYNALRVLGVRPACLIPELEEACLVLSRGYAVACVVNVFEGQAGIGDLIGASTSGKTPIGSMAVVLVSYDKRSNAFGFKTPFIDWPQGAMDSEYVSMHVAEMFCVERAVRDEPPAFSSDASE